MMTGGESEVTHEWAHQCTLPPFTHCLITDWKRYKIRLNLLGWKGDIHPAVHAI